MKLSFSISLLLFLVTSGWLQAQAPNCNDALLSPFCNGIAQYPANFDGTGFGGGPQAPAGANYDCLGTQGNPSYFSLTIDQTGSIDFTLDNTSNLDIDFILWGPFSNVSAAQSACDSMGQGGIWGNVTDCSYSAVGQEPVSIPNAISGEVYILMVTNFSNTATNIFSTLNTGTGSVACPCDIPFSIDTLPVAAGNNGYFTDTVNGINQFVVCPNNTLGFRVSASSNLNDTLGLYAPFTTVNNVFANNTVLSINVGAPARFDSLDIFSLITPTTSEIGINDFTLGLRNSIFTGGLTDSSCFDLLNVQVIVPGVSLSDRNVCPGEQFQIITDSIPSTALGNSSYNWQQLSGIPVTFSSTTSPRPTVTIPPASSSSSNDSIVLVVDYNYGSLCPMSDTMVLRFSDLTMAATALPDSICAGSNSTLGVIFSDSLTTPVCDDYEVTPIPFAPISGTGTTVSAFAPDPDDGVSAPLPIGFSFDFFCNTYTQFVMSTNGFISFDLNAPDGCCSGDILPVNLGFDPNNLIALAWNDLNVTGDALEYFTVGTAPNRILVVNYTTVSHFPGPSTDLVTVQALLYETSNVIEIHTTVQPDNFGIHTQGIENANGTIGFTAPGRNGQAWTATNDAYRFAPRSNGPFYNWTPAATLSNATARNTIASPNTTTSFVVAATDNVCIYTDTIEVAVNSTFAAPVVSCDSTNLTSISFSWSDIGLPPTGFYEYSIDGGATWINAGNSFSATVTGLMSTTSYTVLVRGNSNAGGLCPISPAGNNTCATLNPSCINNPAINITLAPTNPLCNGDSTGCISAVVTGGSGNNNWGFSWSTGQMDTTLICDLPAGSYTFVVSDSINTTLPPTPITLYQEAFDGVNNWNLNIPTGTNGPDNNFWAVSSDEAGQAVGDCGAAGGPNQTLHITSNFVFATGAAYDAGGFCPFLSCPETNMRAESPTFSSIGAANLSVAFNYISLGDGLNDNASVWYNDGSGWQLLTPSIKSVNCSSGQGRWTRYTANLPASCNNQAAVQIGLQWTNNDDGVGTDPSVAIDSVVIAGLQGGTSSTVCVDSQTIQLTEPSPLIFAVDSSSNPTCSGSANGYIAVSTTGGTGGTYSYNWSNGATTDTLTSLNDGSYMVTVSDSTGCTAMGQVILNVPNPLILTVDSSSNPTCSGSADGYIAVSTTGGTGGTYTYNWSNGATTDTLTNLNDGSYMVTVADS
ncbi:MAG: fibronectin type III domain-containing protein, partial [Aureispira sp.]